MKLEAYVRDYVHFVERQVSETSSRATIEKDGEICSLCDYDMRDDEEPVSEFIICERVADDEENHNCIIAEQKKGCKKKLVSKHATRLVTEHWEKFHKHQDPEDDEDIDEIDD